MRRLAIVLTSVFAVTLFAAQAPPGKPRNFIIFVADGLRAGSVNATDTPALWHVRTDGVNFANSHSVSPTLTMPNASAIATGHFPGDTGQFANNVFPGFPIFDTGNFGRAAGTLTPTVEDNRVLGDLDDHFGGNYLQEDTLLSLARKQGYHTAAVGKLGPTAIQDLPELEPEGGRFRAAIKLADGSLYGKAGQVNFADVRVNTQTGSSEARAEIANPTGMLRAGEFARVVLTGAVRPGAIVVPQRAVMESPKGKYVYLVDAEGKSQIRPIEAGDWAGDGWIINGGLNPGDRIVVEGVMKLSLMPPGVPVKIADPAAAAENKGAPAKPGEKPAATPVEKK